MHGNRHYHFYITVGEKQEVKVKITVVLDGYSHIG